MSKKNKGDFFWLGYADLMTSLFFVMLVLFVMTVIHLKLEEAKLIEITKELSLQKDAITAQKEELEKILQLEDQFKPLEEDDNFIYLDDCRKYVAKSLRGKEIFEPGKTIILEEHVEATLDVGRTIETFLNQLLDDNKDFSYLLVIEGNMANSYDGKYDEDDIGGYRTSYNRALAVYDLWQENGITFRKENIEVLISGSGYNGLCREDRQTGNYVVTEDVEAYNKRFSIQIIPKVTHKL